MKEKVQGYVKKELNYKITIESGKFHVKIKTKQGDWIASQKSFNSYFEAKSHISKNCR